MCEPARPFRGMAALALLLAIGVLLGCQSPPSQPVDVRRESPTPAISDFRPQVSPATCSLCAETNPLFIVDKDGNANGTVRLRNRATVPVTLRLTMTDFHAVGHDGNTDPLNAVTALTPVESAEEPILEGTAPLQPGASIAVKVNASSLWQAGLSSATLMNGPEPVVTFKALRYNVPFNVKVESPTPERAVLSLSRYRESYLTLRNEDPMAYRFRSTIEIDGRTMEDVRVVQPYKSIKIPVHLPPESFSWVATGTLRSDVRAGVLRLEYEPHPGLRNYPLPVKRYPLTAHLSYWPDTWQGAWNSFWLLVVLLLGIAASLLINFALPLQRKRVVVKHQLKSLDGRLAGLDEVIDPIDGRLLSQMRVDKKRLREELSALQPIFPQSAVDLPRLQERVTRFSERIEWVSDVGELLQRLARLSGTFSKGESEQLTVQCREILEIAGKTARSSDDLEKATTLLQKVTDSLNDLDAALSAELRQCLQRHSDALRTDVPTYVSGSHGAPFKELLESLVSQFPPKSVAGGPEYAPTRKDFIRHERAVTKASLVVDFLRLVEQSGDADVRTQRFAQHTRLLKALQPGPDESLQNASEIVKQTEQNVYLDDVLSGLEHAFIDADPPTPLPFQLTDLSVRFTRAGVDRAAARNEILYDWVVNGEALPAHGSTVTYFFTDKWRWIGAMFRALRRRNLAAPFRVEVTFRKPGEQAPLRRIVKDDVVLDATRSPVEANTWLSLATLFITVIIVGLGLAGGAREKLESLELLPGAIAVFVLGFGADTLKTLITKIGE